MRSVVVSVLRARRPLGLIAALATAGCAAPVEWRDATALGGGTPADSLLALDAAGTPRLVPSPSPVPASVPAADACPGSLRLAPLARGATRALVAVWWAPRADGSAALLAAESSDGGRTWAQRAPVDTLDRGHAGCARPAPALATDDATGYAHVAYALEAPEGPGVFFAHTMPGHFMFHTPVPIAYGERPRATAVAASGDRVAVAYEDPNARGEPRVLLALSRTQGHVFETAGLAVTGSSAAMGPRVALRGRTLAVAWSSVRGPAHGSMPTLVRVGTVRD